MQWLKKIPVVSPLLKGVVQHARVLRKYGYSSLPNYWRTRICDRRARIRNRTSAEPQVECVCCGWRGQCFLPVFLAARWRDNARCPACGSRERHRAYTAYLRDVERLDAFRGRVLYVAPAACVVKSLFPNHNVAHLVTSDLRPLDVTLQADLTQFPVADAAFDRILCFHVLEHIPNDNAALAELHRVLAVGGVAYIAVPQNFSLEHTEEWGAPRKNYSGHVRDYGRDFADRLNAFDVETLNASDLWGPELRGQWGLGSQEILYRCTKPSSRVH